jgi:beta-lactamase class D
MNADAPAVGMEACMQSPGADDTLGGMLTLAFALILQAAAPRLPPPVAAGECVILAPLDGTPEIVAGGDECDRRTLPASTFKVPHALIALDTGVVTDKTVMKWDGKKKDFPAWERDQTLDSAIKSSVVWFFQRAASAIGRDRELQHLRAFAYGSQTFAREVDLFWLNGDLLISPREQASFLARMFSYQLPIDKRHIDTVKAAMTMPPGKILNATGEHAFPLAWPAGTIARLKTGNGSVGDERASWVVGELESGGRAYVFASRVRSSTRALETTAGADLAVRVLNALPPQRSSSAAADHENVLVDLWARGKPAFGIYVPNENPGPRGAAAGR